MIARDDLDDRACLQRLAETRDGGALRALARRHGPALSRYLQRLVGPTLAEDALQETLLAAYRGAGSFRAESSVKSWLFTIARNAGVKLGKRHREELRDDLDLERLGVRAGWGTETPDTTLSREEQRRALEQALEQIDPADREVLLLRDVEGLSGEDTAAVLGISLAAMKSRLHRARLRLVASVDEREDPCASLEATGP
jgi:RNA polymerase sigma-70 factor, ECF subfamily